MHREIAHRIGAQPKSDTEVSRPVRTHTRWTIAEIGRRGWRGAFHAALFAITTACLIGAPAARWHSTAIGLCEDYPEESRTLANARRDLATAQAAGAQALRIAFGWDAIEATRGAYDWSFWDAFVDMATAEFHVRLIPYVCYTPKWAASDGGENYWRSPPRDPADFAHFLEVLVRRYRDRIHSWELWNEPDNQSYWLGTPAQFAALAKAGSVAVRRADPSARIVLGGIAGDLDFLSTVLHAPGVGPDIDVVNIHSYFETWHPNPIEWLPKYIAAADEVIRQSGGHQPLWMAETGYSSVGPRVDISSSYRAHFVGEHSEIAQANALARTLLETLATERVSLVAWYRINDLPAGQEVIGDDNNRFLGLRRSDGSEKPAYAAFSFLAHAFAQPYETLSPVIRVVRTAAQAVPEGRAFRLRDGRVIVAAWLGTPAGPAGRRPVDDQRSADLRITVPVTRASAVEIDDVLGHPSTGARVKWRQDGSNLELKWTVRAGAVRIALIRP